VHAIGDALGVDAISCSITDAISGFERILGDFEREDAGVDV
jgi:hypothetical protein